jgi:hypothetical protein
VTGYLMRLLPRWPIVLGMLLAITGEFSAFSLVFYPANFLIPIARYVGFPLDDFGRGGADEERQGRAGGFLGDGRKTGAIWPRARCRSKVVAKQGAG